MYEFVSGYAVPLTLFVSLFLGLLVYAYYTYEQSGASIEKNYTIRNFVEDMIEAPEQKKVSGEHIESLQKEMSRLEKKIASLKNIKSKAEAATLQNEINLIHRKIASIYSSPVV